MIKIHDQTFSFYIIYIISDFYREPWLWNECKNDHPRLTSVLEQLKDSNKYEFIVSGRFNGINGIMIEDKTTILNDTVDIQRGIIRK